MRATAMADALAVRFFAGALCLALYAAWITAPRIERAYAQILAVKSLPVGERYSIVRNQSDAMAPTIRNGAMVIVDFSSYERAQPAIGDVVAIAMHGRLFIKRIVAVPGDHFAIKHGKVLTDGRTPYRWKRRWSPFYSMFVGNDTIKVDGLPLDRSVARVPLPTWWGDPAELPDDCYLVLGDNVNDSEDSHVFGCVPRFEIIGEIVKTF